MSNRALFIFIYIVTSKNLNQLVEFLSNQNKDQQEEINQILMINHPLVNWLRSKLDIKYNFYIVGYNDLNQLMLARGLLLFMPRFFISSMKL